MGLQMRAIDEKLKVGERDIEKEERSRWYGHEEGRKKRARGRERIVLLFLTQTTEREGESGGGGDGPEPVGSFFLPGTRTGRRGE